MDASLIRQRAEQEEVERKRKTKYDDQMSILKEDLDAGVDDDDAGGGGSWLGSLFRSPFK
jgi:hypothetical protein